MEKHSIIKHTATAFLLFLVLPIMLFCFEIFNKLYFGLPFRFLIHSVILTLTFLLIHFYLKGLGLSLQKEKIAQVIAELRRAEFKGGSKKKVIKRALRNL